MGAKLSLRPAILMSSTYTDKNILAFDESIDIPNASLFPNFLVSGFLPDCVPMISLQGDGHINVFREKLLDHWRCSSWLDDDYGRVVSILQGTPFPEALPMWVRPLHVFLSVNRKCIVRFSSHSRKARCGAEDSCCCHLRGGRCTLIRLPQSTTRPSCSWRCVASSECFRWQISITVAKRTGIV